jgi:hypothetical protein
MAILKGEVTSGYAPEHSAAHMPASPGRPGESGLLWQKPQQRFVSPRRVIAGGSEFSGFTLDANISAAYMPQLPGRPGEGGPLGQTLPQRFERQSEDTSPQRVIAGGSEFSGFTLDANISAAYVPAKPGSKGKLEISPSARSGKSYPIRREAVFPGTSYKILDIVTVPATGKLGEALRARMPASIVGKDVGARDLSLHVVYLEGADEAMGEVVDGFTGKETVRLLAWRSPRRPHINRDNPWFPAAA